MIYRINLETEKLNFYHWNRVSKRYELDTRVHNQTPEFRSYILKGGIGYETTATPQRTFEMRTELPTYRSGDRTVLRMKVYLFVIDG